MGSKGKTWPRLGFFGVIIIFSMTSAYGLEENGLIDLPFTESPPIIDGRWTTPEEWTDASQTTISNANDAMVLLAKDDRNFVYIMADVTSDYYQESQVNYALGLYFDTDNAGEVFREKDDMRFVYGKSSLFSDPDGLCMKCKTREGGGVWGFNVNTMSCERTNQLLRSNSGSATAEAGTWIDFSTEEIKRQIVAITILAEKGHSCEASIVASLPTGHDVNVVDFGSAESKSVKTNPPSAFGYRIGFSSQNDPFESGRDHRVYEFKIPIEFLHKSNSYGFGVIYWVRDTEFSTLSWPPGIDWESPATYGSLVSSAGAVTAPPVPFMVVSTKSFDFGNVEVSGKATKTFNVKNTGTGLLKIESVRSSGEFALEGERTSVELGPNQGIDFQVIFSPLSIGTKSGSVTITSNDLSSPTYTIALNGAGAEKGASPIPTGGGGCLIATAAFGSEFAPQVQMLREIRENVLFGTDSGAGFMTTFNALYYTISPAIADLERQNPVFKESVRIAITPMLSTLSILNYVEIDSEQEMLGYGIGIILLNVGMYFVVPAFVILRLARRQD